MPYQEKISESQAESLRIGNKFAKKLVYNRELRKVYNNFVETIRTVVRAEGKQQRFQMLQVQPGHTRGMLFDSIGKENLQGLANAFGVVIERREGEIIIAQSQGVLGNLSASRGRARSNQGLPKDKVPARAGFKW